MNKMFLCLNQFRWRWVVLSIPLVLLGCENGTDNKPGTEDIWDIDTDGIPRFVETNYIELSKIYRISKFRSSVGHDYSDAFEDCRSMKHYFEPTGTVDWSTVMVFSPIAGTITRVEQEWAGTKIEIASDLHPAFRFSIFHVSLVTPRNVDDRVTEGEQLGTHIGSQTMSDISIIVNDPTRQGRMVSFFEVMTDSLFTQYIDRGVASRDSLIISKQARDADTLTCSGDTFLNTGTLLNWITLN